MSKKSINKVMKALKGKLQKRCKACGINTEYFGAKIFHDEKGRADAIWYFLRTQVDDSIFIDLLDDLECENEIIWEHRIEDFPTELTEAQKLVFREYEPRFATIRTIYRMQDLQDLQEEFKTSIFKFRKEQLPLLERPT